MPTCQMDAYLAIAHQIPAITEELRKANRLKALELKIRIQNDWPNSSELLDEIDKIMAD